MKKDHYTSNNASSKLIFHQADSGEELSLRDVVARVRLFIEHDQKAHYEVIVGSDSQELRGGEAQFVSAITIRKVGNGGVYFWTRLREQTYGLHNRISRETMLSILLAQELKSLLKDILGENIFWDKRLTFEYIHLDVGHNGLTSKLIESVCGIVKGYNFEPVIKPDAFGAFVVADRHT